MTKQASIEDDPQSVVTISTKISITWVLTFTIPLIWGCIKLNSTVDNLTIVTTDLKVAVTTLNADNAESIRSIDLLKYKVNTIQNHLATMKTSEK